MMETEQSDARELRRVIRWGMLFEVGLGLSACIIGYFTGQAVLQRIHWRLADVAIGIAVSLPMIGAFVAGNRWPIGPLRPLKEFAEEVIRPMFAPCTMADLVILCIVAGFGEEMLFRGIVQDGLVRWLGLGAGVVVASVLFGLVHPISPTYVILAALAGAYLGLSWIVTDNLLVPIVAHALYDFVALMILTKGGLKSEVRSQRSEVNISDL